jgi:hypothetical protein
MTTQYNIDKFSRGVNGFGLPFCDTIYSVTLGANTDKSVTIPGASADFSISVPKYMAVISYSPAAKVYVAVNQTAEVPVGSSFAVTASELNPPAKYVKAGDVIHVISAATADVTIAIYAFETL